MGHAPQRRRGQRVVRVLDWLKQTRGVPEVIQVDNGPEFISQAVDQWAFANGVRLHLTSLPAPDSDSLTGANHSTAADPENGTAVENAPEPRGEWGL